MSGKLHILVALPPCNHLTGCWVGSRTSLDTESVYYS